MELRSIIAKDIGSIADIHMMAFPISGLTQFGRETTQRYYLWHLESAHETQCIGAFINSELVGYIIAGVFRNSEVEFLTKNGISLVWHLITHVWLLKNEIIRKKVNYGIKVLSRKFINKEENNQTPKQYIAKYGVLAIATHPEFKGLGIGKLMMKEVEQIARQKRFSSMRLTVHTDNLQAVLFYEKLGWQKIPTVEGKWKGNMKKSIGNGNM
jgi:ribosomal protein S18 acetylase RimI-like enzyme